MRYFHKLKNEKKFSRLPILFFFQISVLLVYLNLNVVNVGGDGVALQLLLIFFVTSLFLVTSLLKNGKIYLKNHLFLFSIFVVWISFRVIFDLGDIYYLKQITVATSGGILLFYMIGALVSLTSEHLLLNERNLVFIRWVFMVFFGLLLWMSYNFSLRVRSDIFYLNDVNGIYQRSGDFLSISFVIISLLHFVHILNISLKSGSFKRYLFIYTVCAFLAIVGSQLFGSNSATAVSLGVFMITLVMMLVVRSKSIIFSYFNGDLNLPWSKTLFKFLIILSCCSFLALTATGSFLIYLSDFDLSGINLFSFDGSGVNSLNSRFEIFAAQAFPQLGFSPWFGNMNVAYLTTGDEGKYIHSLFPYVLSHLGYLGFLILLTLFIAIFIQFYNLMKVNRYSGFMGYQRSMIALYNAFILFFLILFSNIATSVSWSVLWFSIGLFSVPVRVELADNWLKNQVGMMIGFHKKGF